MEDNSLLMIILAFVVGYMCSGMIKNMCGGRLVEGSYIPTKCMYPTQCNWKSFYIDNDGNRINMPLDKLGECVGGDDHGGSLGKCIYTDDSGNKYQLYN
tara:strand:- start:231 stop:527 length:297 start_codon:yes stop_codon:yes gene_type:complete